MRIEHVEGRKGSKAGLVGAALVFAAGALLAGEGAPTKHATSLMEAARPEAAGLASISPREATADRDTLDLQLD